MADIKFTGVTFDYNSVTIQIASDVIGASQIGISGVKIGTAADFDRIKSQLPGVVNVKDGVSSDLYSTTGFFYYNTDKDIRKLGSGGSVSAKITQDKTKDTTKYINLS